MTKNISNDEKLKFLPPETGEKDLSQSFREELQKPKQTSFKWTQILACSQIGCRPLRPRLSLVMSVQPWAKFNSERKMKWMRCTKVDGFPFTHGMPELQSIYEPSYTYIFTTIAQKMGISIRPLADTASWRMMLWDMINYYISLDNVCKMWYFLLNALQFTQT